MVCHEILSQTVHVTVRLMKESSSRRIQEEFPQLGNRYWGKHFLGIGYAVFSSVHVTDEMIQEYLSIMKIIQIIGMMILESNDFQSAHTSSKLASFSQL